MWSGVRTVLFESASVDRGVEGTMCSCCRTAALGFSGAGSRFGALGCPVASGAAALVSFGVIGTIAGRLLEDVGTADDD
jgi:hypothetical protein